MKREFTHWLHHVCGVDGGVFMRLALLLVVCMTSIGGWAETKTATFSTFSSSGVNDNYYSASITADDNSQFSLTVTFGNDDLSTGKDGLTSAASETYMQIKVDGSNITGVSIYYESGRTPYTTATCSCNPAGSYNLNSNVAEWKLSGSTTSSVAITYGSTESGATAIVSNKVRITKVIVTYESSTSTNKQFDDVSVADQTMTVAGTLDLSELVKATESGNPVDGANISYEITNGKDYVTLGEDGHTLTAKAAGDAAVKATISKDGYDTKEVTINVSVNASDLPTVEVKVADKTVTKGFTFEPTVEYVKITNADGTEELLTDYTISYSTTETNNLTVNTDGTITSGGSGNEKTGYKATATVAGVKGKYQAGSCEFYVKVLNSVNEAVVTSDETTVTESSESGIDYEASYTIMKGEKISPYFYIVANGERIALPKEHIYLNYTDYKETTNTGENSVLLFAKATKDETVNSFSDFTDQVITGNSAGTATVKIKIRDDRKAYDSESSTTQECKLLKETVIKLTINVLNADNITAPSLTDSWSKEYKKGETPSENVTITNTYYSTNSASYVIYTTDGTDPSLTNGTKIENAASATLTISSSTVVKAMAVVVVDGVTKTSEIVEGHYTLIEKSSSSEGGGTTGGDDSKETKIIDKKAYDAGDRIELNNIVMTFGGVYGNTCDDAWDELTKSGSTVGSDGVLSNGYSVSNDNDALIETATVGDKGKAGNAGQAFEYKHYKSDAEAYQTYERVKNLPAYGDYFKFEPKKNGTLTVYVEQQGSIYTDGTDANDKTKKVNNYTKIRLRPLYFIDEQGLSQKATGASTTSRLDPDWKKIVRADLLGSNDDAEETMYTTAQMQTIYDFYLTYLKGLYASKNSTTNVDDVTEANALTMCDGKNYNPIFVLHYKDKTFTDASSESTALSLTNEYTATEKSYINAIQEIFDREIENDKVVVKNAVKDNTGYFLLTEGYVKYTFPVKAGKTYFLFGDRTKIGLSGFIFNPGTTSAETLTLATSATSGENTNAIEDVSGKTVTATVNRSFAKGYWYSLVLPFSVSTTQLQQALSETTNTATGSESELPNEKGMRDVKILYFKDIDVTGSTLNLHHYFHHFIPAGTPLFIRAEKAVSSVTFTNVQVEKTAVEAVKAGDFSLNGSFDTYSAPVHSYILLNTANSGMDAAGAGKFYQNETGSSYTLGAMCAAIEGATKEMSISIDGMNDEGGTSGIVETIASGKANGAVCGNDAIYNLNGQVVGHGLELYTLPKGIYITKGKKYIVR